MVTKRRPADQHIAERFFERLLRLRGYLDFAYEEGLPGTSRRPDYRVTVEGHDVYFEVKSFEPEPARAGAFMFDPIEPVRDRIEQARKKFKGFKSYPCALVLFNPGGRLVFLGEPEQVYSAMFGDAAWKVSFDPKTGRLGEIGGTVFTKNGKMIHHSPNGPKAQNTTVSAIVALVAHRDDDGSPPDPETVERIGAFVYHNPYARLALPSPLFRGSWDRIFDRLQDDPTTIGPVHVGENVPLRDPKTPL